MKNFILITLIFSISLASCNGSNFNDSNSENLNKKIEDAIQSTFGDLGRTSKPHIEEFNKLSQIEYKVEIFQNDSSKTEIENRLNQLGKERWDCFSSFEKSIFINNKNDSYENTRSRNISKETVILCKRMPETVLRYLPKSLIGK
jgi:hypothetical protein